MADLPQKTASIHKVSMYYFEGRILGGNRTSRIHDALPGFRTPTGCGNDLEFFSIQSQFNPIFSFQGNLYKWDRGPAHLW